MLFRDAKKLHNGNYFYIYLGNYSDGSFDI